MAEHVLPQHKPHDQLRTEAPAQRPHTDKYVSAFVSGKNVTELTFKNPILEQSADHFKVGIDDLTVNLGSLSMLDFSDPTEVLIRIKRRGVTLHPLTDANEVSDAVAAHMRHFLMPDFVVQGSQAENDLTAAQVAFQAAVNGSAAEAAAGRLISTFYAPGTQRAKFRDGFEFKVDRVFVTMQEIMERFSEIATAVNRYIYEFGLLADDPNSPGYTLWNHFANGNYFEAGTRGEYLRIQLSTNGQLQISASRIFWANFVIEVPLEKYRQILFKNPDRLEVVLHPGTGALDPLYQRLGFAFPAVFEAIALHDWDRDITDAADRAVSFVGSGNLFSTIDRRVTLEVGCSLPIKNSPLIDHGVEAPDFVLGRYMFHKPYTLGATEYTQASLGVQTIQGARDRVVYHHLRPQQKIQALRLRLWVRVRKYDIPSQTWSMSTMLCPIDAQDYWHIRLHFKTKDL